MFKKVIFCRICNSTNLERYLDFGSHPLANDLQEGVNLYLRKFSLEVLICENCFLSQLSVVVDPDIMFKEYAYHSSISQTFKDHCYQMALKLKAEFQFEYPLVVDIASNDGCLLNEFKRAGYKRFLGFEPATNLSAQPYGWIDGKPGDELGIPVVNSFFTEKIAMSTRGDKAGQGASIVTAQNVFAHVNDLHDFLRGVHWMLDDNGVFIVEVPYLPNLIENNEFDTIYHEHISYFLLKPLVRLFKDCSLPIFRVEKYPIHGGSIRIYASKDFYQLEDSVELFLDEEDQEGFYDINIYRAFAKRVEKTKIEFQTLMELLYRSNKKVMGYGASAKGISLINYCGIPKEYIHSIVDDTPAKQGKLTPGSYVPIVDFSHFDKENPDFILLLAWNFAKELIEKTAHHKERGAYHLVPIPEFKIV